MLRRIKKVVFEFFWQSALAIHIWLIVSGTITLAVDIHNNLPSLLNLILEFIYLYWEIDILHSLVRKIIQKVKDQVVSREMV